MTTVTMESYPMVVYRDAGLDGSICFVAAHPHLPGCEVWASSEPEAVALLDQARVGYLRALKEHGQPVPQPGPLDTERLSWTIVNADGLAAGVPATELRALAVA